MSDYFACLDLISLRISSALFALSVLGSTGAVVSATGLVSS